MGNDIKKVNCVPFQAHKSFIMFWCFTEVYKGCFQTTS